MLSCIAASRVPYPFGCQPLAVQVLGLLLPVRLCGAGVGLESLRGILPLFDSLRRRRALERWKGRRRQTDSGGAAAMERRGGGSGGLDAHSKFSRK